MCKDRCYSAEGGAAHIKYFWASIHIPHALCKKKEPVDFCTHRQSCKTAAEASKITPK